MRKYKLYYLNDVYPRVDGDLCVEHGRVDEELLQEQLEAIALVHVVHEYQPLALHII